MTVWLNGDLIDGKDACIRPDDRGFTLGDGLFETMAVRDGAIPRLNAHLSRLRLGCETLLLPLSVSNDCLREALGQIIDVNHVSHGTLRLTIARGPAPRGVLPPEDPRPTVLITVLETAPSSLGPATAVIATKTRRNEYSPLSRIKSLNYLDGILAGLEAAGCGADEALLLNTGGKLAEAAAANLFAVIGDRCVTPPIADGALPGVMRAVVMEFLGAAARSLLPADLDGASEVFLTSASGIRPVVRIDGKDVGNGQPGPVWESLGGLILGGEKP